MGNTKEIVTRLSLKEWVVKNIGTLQLLEQPLVIGWPSWRSMIPARVLPMQRYGPAALTETSAVQHNRLP
jgi:hypothetical protein